MYKYYNNLAIAETTHPGVVDYFRNGGISTRRSVRNFSRSSNDLVLEQTQNADASNKLTGIVSMHNSIDTRRKWAETHSARTFVTSTFLESIGLVKLDDVGESQYQSRMFIDHVNCRKRLKPTFTHFVRI